MKRMTWIFIIVWFAFCSCSNPEAHQEDNVKTVKNFQRSSLEEQEICHCYFANGLIMPYSDDLNEICNLSSEVVNVTGLDELEVICAYKYYRPFRHIFLQADGLDEAQKERLKKRFSRKIDSIKIEQSLRLNMQGKKGLFFPKEGESPMILLFSVDFISQEWDVKYIKVLSGVYAKRFSDIIAVQILQDEMMSSIDQMACIVTYWEPDQVNFDKINLKQPQSD